MNCSPICKYDYDKWIEMSSQLLTEQIRSGPKIKYLNRKKIYLKLHFKTQYYVKYFENIFFLF